MTVDLVDVREHVLDFIASHIKAAMDTFVNFSLMEVGVILTVIGTIAGLNVIWHDWRKKKGYRMVLRDRNDKAHALLTQIINDGLFEAECAGKISTKEVLALYSEMSKKLDLPDLVPKQRRLKLVKAELKKLRNSKDPEVLAARAHHPKIPGGPPTPIVRKKFKEYVGSFANKMKRTG
jgi:hypothetical protein